MKKTFIILVLILSFGFVINVDAKEAVYVSQKKLVDYSFSEFFKFNDKYYFFDKYGPNYYYDFYSLAEDSTPKEFSNYYYFYSHLIFKDNLFASKSGKLIKFNKNNEVIASYEFNNKNSSATYLSAINDDNLLVYYCYSYGSVCSFNYFTSDLELIKTVDANYDEFDYIDYFNSYNNKSVVLSGANLFFLDKDLNVKKRVKDFVNDKSLSDAKVFGEDGLFLLYIDDSYYSSNHSNKVFVYNYDLDGNLKWYKEYDSSLRNTDGYTASISKTDEGNFIVSNGSFVEIDKKGNVINSCPRCYLFTGTLKIDDTYYGVSVDYGDIINNPYMYRRNSMITQLKFIDESKLTIKESENGRVRINRSNPHVGEEVIITLRPQNGYEYGVIKLLDKDGKKVEVKKITDKKYSFIMPSGESTLEVLFKKLDK